MSGDHSLHAAFDPMAVGVLLCRPDLLVQYANPPALALFALPLGELVGRSFAELLGAEDRPWILAHFASGDFAREGRSCHCLRGDGRRVEVEVSVQRLDGEVLILLRDLRLGAMRAKVASLDRNFLVNNFVMGV